MLWHKNPHGRTVVAGGSLIQTHLGACCVPDVAPGHGNTGGGRRNETHAALTQALQTRGGTWAQTLTVGGIGNKHLEGALEPCLVRQKGFPQEVTTEVCL